MGAILTTPRFAGHLFEAANLRAVVEVLGTVQARLNLKQDVGCEILAQFDKIGRRQGERHLSRRARLKRNQLPGERVEDGDRHGRASCTQGQRREC